MRVASDVSLRMKTGVLYFRAIRGGFDRNIETIFHACGREHDSRAVAVTAEDRLMQITLLNVRRQTCAWAPALNVADDQRDLGH